jgi:hypothetical protein
VPSIEVLGNLDADRLSIVSFVVRKPGGQYLHHNAVVALLNDLFGIQARGGCSCAGPYGHRLLGIDIERSHEYERAITAGCEGIKPGWVRVNFNYFIDEDVFQYVVRAIAFVAEHGHAFLSDYSFDPDTGLWRHRDESTETPLRLTGLEYDAHGLLTQPARPATADPTALPGYLAEAASLLESRRTHGDDSAHFSSDFDALRWFELPSACLHPAGASDERAAARTR